MAQILVMDGPGVGTTYELVEQNSIGRGASCSIRLNSDSLAEQQAVIRKKGNGFVIVAGNSGSVLVNNQPIQQEHKLTHGDMITMADIMLLYGEEGAPAETPAATQYSTRAFAAVTTGDGEKIPTVRTRQKFFRDSDTAIQNINQSKHASWNMEVLIKVSHAIMSKLELKELLQQLLDIIFEKLPADRGTIFLRDPKGNKLWPMASRKREDVPQTDKLMASRTIIREVLETKEGVLTKDATEDARFQMGVSIAAQQIHAALCVPMVGKNDEVLGIIHIDTVRADRVFTEEHLKLVTAIAMQASLAIENSLLVQQLGEKKRIEQELTIASHIQMQLLPQEMPTVAGIELYGLMVPAKEVGGDYYDFVMSEEDQQAFICIGDVSGKGVPAGLVMVMARCFFRPLILSCQNTREILDKLNTFLVADTRKGMFMSMLVLHWNEVEKKFYWTGAGHEHLLIYHAATKTCEPIRAGGIVLGMMKKASMFFKEQELSLDPDDGIFLYTDGVTECVGPQGKMFELERVVSFVEQYGHLSAEAFCKTLLEELHRFMGKTEQHDDITIVAIKRR